MAKFAIAAAFGLTMLVGIGVGRAWDETPLLRVQYLAFPVQWEGKTVMLGARFQTPLNVSGKVPAVIMLHNGYGVNYRGVYYAAALNKAGIATLEIDQYGGRGIAGGRGSLGPINGLPDIGAAFRLLAERAEIDTARIGLTGFSLGGIQTMLMMSRRNSETVLGPDKHLQAAMALYPVCWRYNHTPGFEFAELVDAPVRILVGTEDDLDDGAGPCEALVRDLAPADKPHVSLRVFANATPAFDGFDGPSEINFPPAHRGQGGVQRIRPNPEAREAARADMVGFFATALKPK
ncbi:MAG TPA: dienelactone hydrolase family protein [Stellaceae bacterium]